MAIEPGTVVAKRYRVHARLGVGGMGEVFSAENTRTGRMVAIKVLRAESKAKQSAIERFRREARAAGSIRSDFVTEVLDVEDDPDYGIVLVFELLEGESLVERLKRTGPIPYVELWGIVEAVWMGLCDAHAAGVIHRDLKPSNVFLEQRKGGGLRVKILDFGISKLPKKVGTHSLTQVGQSLGTFSFMPPEQIGKAKSVDHRADVYACATLIFQGLSGRLPYQARNVVDMMELKARTEPRLLSEMMPEPVDPSLESFVARGLARDPNARFQTAAEALERWRQLRPAGAMSLAEPDTASGREQASSPRLADLPATLAMPAYQPQAVNEAQPFAAAEPLPPTRRDGAGYAARTPAPMAPPAGQVRPSSTRPDPAVVRAQSAAVQQPPAAFHLQPPAAHAGLAHSHHGGGPPSGGPTSPPTLPEHFALRGSGPAAPPGSRLRTTLALLLGAIGLMVAGFAIVALLLHFIGGR